MKEYIPLLAALATAPACNAGSIKLEDTSVEPADIQLTGDTAAEPATVNANEDGQRLGCLSLTSDTETQIQTVVAMNQGYSEEDGGWIDNPAAAGEGGFVDRTGALTADGEEIAPAIPAGSDGTFRFLDMTAELEVNRAYELCITGNPGATTGEFRHVIWQDGLIADTDVGSSQTFPLAFTPFTVE